MIRGAIILGIGFSLGYAKALHDSEDINEKLSQLIEFAKEASARGSASTEDAAETPADVTAEAVEVPVTPAATEGE